MSPTHQDLSNDTAFSQIKSRVPVPLNEERVNLIWLYIMGGGENFRPSWFERDFVFFTKGRNFHHREIGVKLFSFGDFFWRGMKSGFNTVCCTTRPLLCHHYMVLSENLLYEQFWTSFWIFTNKRAFWIIIEYKKLTNNFQLCIWKTQFKKK